ncbi:MAG: molybdenum cofactor guanylyltransferase [Gammaproteobacteria bacterium]|nr:molybdenum cofactor guanylyltransferase [Gammaproteobacteria bacterium]
MTIHVADTTAIILAGGMGRRMDSLNKGLITLKNKSLINYVIETLTPQVSDIIISANADINEYRKTGFAVVQDQFSESLGPLAGIASALELVTSTYAVITPCDSPFIPPQFVSRMAQVYQNSNADVCIVNDGERAQPLFMFLKTEMKTSLLHSLEQSQRKVFAWLNSVSTIEVDFSDFPGAFININTPQDLITAEKHV